MFDALRGLIQWTPLGLPAFLFVITVVVFFHELGHFLMARAFKVKVDIFSVGFGKELFGWTARSGTRWRVSAIPIGGYVKFAGDANAASAPDHDAARQATAEERALMLQFKPLPQRALVAFAGPLANFLLAIAMFTGLNLYSGHNVVTPVIGEVIRGSAAEAAGIRPGDLVTGVDGTAIDDFYQLPEIVGLSGGHNLAISLVRQGRPMVIHVVPRMMRMPDPFGNVGDTVVIGVRPSLAVPVTHVAYGPWGAFTAASTETWDIMRETVAGIGQMVRGYVSPDQFRGPVGIAQMTRKVASFGFLALINLASVLSVSIGLANLFPIPILDGGHLLYYACEAVLGRPLGERAQDVGLRLGMVLVLGLILLTTWNDLVRLNLF
jgi:regulator of sigma E protease